MLDGMKADPPSINTDGLNSTNVAVNVHDWQENVNYVFVDLSPLGGSKTAYMSTVFTDEWVVNDIHYKSGGLGAGTYNLLMTAGSAGLETYNYVPVTVSDLPTPGSITVVAPNGGGLA